MTVAIVVAVALVAAAILISAMWMLRRRPPGTADVWLRKRYDARRVVYLDVLIWIQSVTQSQLQPQGRIVVNWSEDGLRRALEIESRLQLVGSALVVAQYEEIRVSFDERGTIDVEAVVAIASQMADEMDRPVP